MLHDLPTIRVITLKESLDRQNNFVSQISKYTNNYKFITFDRFENTDFNMTGDTLYLLHSNSYGSISSHLYNLYDWYYSCEDDYCIIMEDDISFATLNYWKFTLKDFINKLPNSWEAIQLILVSENMEDPVLRNRLWGDWCLAAFIVKREYAKKVIEHHVINSNTFNVTLKGSRAPLVPIPESIILNEDNKNIYSFPLFVEDIINCNSTYKGTELIMENGQGPFHRSSYHFILNWWKNNNIDLKRIFK